MASIAVYFDDPGFDQYPFDDPGYAESYHRLAEAVLRLEGEFYIVRSKDTYVSGNRFSRGWKFEDGAFKEVDDEIEVDLVYVKGSDIEFDWHAHVINDPRMNEVCRNKLETYKVFPHLFPRTQLAETAEELRQILPDFPGDRVVIKPLEGFGGEGVCIGPKEEALARTHEFPVIAQEFIDTTEGIEDVADGLHDYRIVVMDGDIFNTTVREPAPGKLLSNVAQGGQMRLVLPEDRPAEAEQLVTEIDRHFRRYPRRLYSIDCGRDRSGRWRLFELNDQPGLQYVHELGDRVDEYFGSYARYFLDAAEDDPRD